MVLSRRFFLFSGVLLAADGSATVRGKLGKNPEGRPALQTSSGKWVPLTGDPDSLGVLNDERLAGTDFEVAGTPGTPGFTINPIHMAALHVWEAGKRKRVTYWCDICAIRTYTPGLCWCCRDETVLDLRDPDKVENK